MARSRSRSRSKSRHGGRRRRIRRPRRGRGFKDFIKKAGKFIKDHKLLSKAAPLLKYTPLAPAADAIGTAVSQMGYGRRRRRSRSRSRKPVAGSGFGGRRRRRSKRRRMHGGAMPIGYNPIQGPTYPMATSFAVPRF